MSVSKALYIVATILFALGGGGARGAGRSPAAQSQYFSGGAEAEASLQRSHGLRALACCLAQSRVEVKLPLRNEAASLLFRVSERRQSA